MTKTATGSILTEKSEEETGSYDLTSYEVAEETINKAIQMSINGKKKEDIIKTVAMTIYDKYGGMYGKKNRSDRTRRSKG